jgi:competence protein ComEA
MMNHLVPRTLLAALALASATAALPAHAQRDAPTVAEAPAASEGVVNIQTATVEELQLLPGIGPSKAEAIVAHRERRAFRRVQDILRVRGIGRGTFRRIRDMITVEGPTTRRVPSGRAARPSGG